MISYDELIQKYGYDLNITKLFYNPYRVDFRGISKKDGQYIVCKLNISINKFKQLKTENVIVPINMLHSFLDIELINNNIFKDLIKNGEVSDVEIEEFLDYYDSYNRMIDSVFNQNNVYGVSYNDFNTMIRQNKLSNQISDVSKVSKVYSYLNLSEVIISENIEKSLLHTYYLKIHRLFKSPETTSISVSHTDLIYYNRAKDLISTINTTTHNSINVLTELQDLVKSCSVDLYKDLGGYKLIDTISNKNIRAEFNNDSTTVLTI